jgi:hypothetical protein
MIFQAHNEEAARVHDLCLGEMATYEMTDDSDNVENTEDPSCHDSDLDLCDFGHDAFKLFDGDFVPLPEDAWQANDLIDPLDCAMGTLRCYMENVKPDEIFLQEPKWIAKKYSLLTAMIIAGSFSKEIFDEPTAIVGRYGVAFEESLRELGIEFEPFKGITEAGWETFNKFHTSTTVVHVGHC